MYVMVNVRLGSSRLPGKVLRKFNDGSTPLEHLIERVTRAEYVDGVIINTTTEPVDDELEKFCIDRSLKYHRGPQDDVLKRMTECVNRFELESFVEVYGDCPLVDPQIVDYMITQFKTSNYDFVGNDLKTTYPPGFEVEVVNSASLLASDKLCDDPEIREHGTLYIRQNPEIFKIKNVEYHRVIENMPHLTMDTLEDFILIEKIITKFNKTKFTIEDVLAYLDLEHGLKNINAHIERKWKKYRNE